MSWGWSQIQSPHPGGIALTPEVAQWHHELKAMVDRSLEDVRQACARSNQITENLLTKTIRGIPPVQNYQPTHYDTIYAVAPTLNYVSPQFPAVRPTAVVSNGRVAEAHTAAPQVNPTTGPTFSWEETTVTADPGVATPSHVTGVGTNAVWRQPVPIAPSSLCAPGTTVMSRTNGTLVSGSISDPRATGRVCISASTSDSRVTGGYSDPISSTTDAGGNASLRAKQRSTKAPSTGSSEKKTSLKFLKKIYGHTLLMCVSFELKPGFKSSLQRRIAAKFPTATGIQFSKGEGPDDCHRIHLRFSTKYNARRALKWTRPFRFIYKAQGKTRNAWLLAIKYQYMEQPSTPSTSEEELETIELEGNDNPHSPAASLMIDVSEFGDEEVYEISDEDSD